jgi:hypothetical protein
MLALSRLFDVSAFTSTLTTGAISTANNIIGAVLRPKPGATITHIYCYCTAVTSPPILKASLQTVTSGNPSGTDIAGASGTFTPVAGTLHVVQLGTPYVVPTQPVPIAVCISYSSGTVGASNSATINYRWAFPTTNLLSYSRYFTSTWDALTTSNTPCVFVKYSDGTLGIEGSCPIASTNTVVIGPAQTYDEVGVKISLPFSYRCTGYYFHSRLQSTSVKLHTTIESTVAQRGVLYDNTDHDILGSQVYSNASPYGTIVEFPSPIWINANELVNFWVKNTGASTLLTVSRATFLSDEVKTNSIGFTNATLIGLVRKNSVITETGNNIPILFPIIDKQSLIRQGSSMSGGFLV